MAELKRCKKCGKISYWNSYFDGYMCECGNIERKTTTNADRIRAMSDEELAVFLVSVENRRRGNGCGAVWHLPDIALEWLKQPAEEVHADG